MVAMAVHSHRPDSPCLGFCTTALGDDVCKSCGRTFEELTRWIIMSPNEKAVVWARLNLDDWWQSQRRARNGG
ncbi:DUF1289 domain-containing protein [Acidithiobacillus ferrivorans]|uniref:DUF1289 domain-containing protein n=1 Tax=Acidithiobacillus ferrivorans TaxID=160808 RepID=UPI00279584C1|nr:DUF1289 domain-containing protein [Acidithiobacillus ferrivorans]